MNNGIMNESTSAARSFIDTGVSSVASDDVLSVRTSKMAANSAVVGMIVV
jgi:hypothetical protein